MRKILLAAICAASVSACGGRAAVKPSSPGDVDAVKRRADAAFAANDREAGFAAPQTSGGGKTLSAPTGTVSAGAEPSLRREPESRRGRVLGTDPEGCTWVVGESTIAVGDQDTPAQARAAAVEQARAAAVQDFLGVDISAKFLDFQQEGLRHDSRLVDSLLQTTRNGRIIKEKLGEHGFSDAPGCRSCRYSARVEACVIPLDAGRDKQFNVDLRLSRVKFVQGDEATLSISATRDCSVYLYDVYDLAADNKTALVFPNEAVPGKTLKAGETWEYPDEAARKRGVRLVAELPNKTDDVSAETIIVVATKTPLAAAQYDPADGGYLGVFRRLHHSKTDWAEDAEAYTIYRR